MDITICDDGFVAEVKNDSDFNALITMLFGEPEDAEEGEWTTYWWEVTDEDSDSCGEELHTNSFPIPNCTASARYHRKKPK